MKQSKYNNQYVRVYKNDFRADIKNKDPQAILKGLQSDILVHENGVKDSNALIDEDSKNNIKRESYTVTYPDGSTVTLKGSTVRESDDNEEVQVNGTPIIGPWNNSAKISSTNNAGFANGQPSAGNYVSTTEWQFTSGTSYAKIKNLFTLKGIRKFDLKGAGYE